MKVAIDTGPIKGERIFGIGLNTKYLLAALLKEVKRSKNVQVEYFDFSADQQKLEKGNFDILHYPYFHPFFYYKDQWYRSWARILTEGSGRHGWTDRFTEQDRPVRSHIDH